MLLKFNINQKYIEFEEVDEELISLLQTDDDFCTNFVMMAIKQQKFIQYELKENDEIQEIVRLDEIPEIEEPDEFHESAIHSILADETNIQPRKWSEKTTKLLVETRLSMEKEFTKPKCKKSKLWENIAKTMQNVAKQSYTEIECDNKYRNLLETYKANEKKSESSGEAAVVWPYFTLFNYALAHKVAIEPPQETLGAFFNSGDLSESHSPLSSPSNISNS